MGVINLINKSGFLVSTLLYLVKTRDNTNKEWININSKYNYNIDTDKEPTNFIVYCATSPSDKQYIGITSVNITTRIRQHVNSAMSNRTSYKFSRAIRKYGIENIKFKIIDYASSKEELFNLERYYISFYDTYKKGYNLTLGGDGVLGFKHTKEQNKNNSLRHKLYFSNIENREKQSKAIKQSYINNPELKTIQSEIHKNLCKDRDYIKKINISRGLKPFKVYSIDGKYIGEWFFHIDCAKTLNLLDANINKCLRGEISYYKGYVFVYDDSCIESILELVNKRINKLNKQFNVYDKNNNLVGSWNSQSQCMKDLNLRRQGISNCLNGRLKTTKGYKLYYSENDPYLNNKEVI